MSKVFAIYPTDKQESTKFLNKINTFLCKELKDDWHCYKIKFTDEDHENCINKAIENDAKLIFFMGHGKSDCLYGSFAKGSQDFISYDAMNESEDYYKNEYFIHRDNIGRFNNKIFFSFSCSSNRNETNSLGRNAIKNEVFSFIGFGNIPTDYILKNKINDKVIDKKVIAQYKGIIIRVIKKSIYLSIKESYTINRLVDLITILINKEIQNILLKPHANWRNEQLINLLYLFKNEIVIFGNKYESIV